ncbi:MAG: dockerin type I repeat-containing protein [Oscillospiraceae bacterium]|nr:dockerin type I repeat-containing protein [Oscillospiraceae bacterium]
MKKKAKSILVFMLATLMSIQCIFLAFGATVQGDVSGDGKIDAGDARGVLRIAVGLDKVSGDVKKIADIDGDGNVTAGDARIVLRIAVGLEKIEDYSSGGGSTGSLLSASEIRSIAINSIENYIYIVNELFGMGLKQSEYSVDLDVAVDGVAGTTYMWRSEVIDPAYKTVDDVYNAVRKVFSASYADGLLTMAKNARGGPEYRLMYTDMYGSLHLFSMYKEENGKLYYYVIPSEPMIWGNYIYKKATVQSQTSDEIKVSMDVSVMDPYDGETKFPAIENLTLIKENGEWKLDSYATYYK